ncbi:transcription antitermination protein [Salmonella enterica subsp. enterica]|uniref:Transcription termination/antitermination protein NusG n=35 Tax=Bacteria TaxID=2 RepID=A0A379X2M7_SALET|nr:transcription antitermination protein [Salmonella enterica subsp. enterica]
MSEAPKKRWYVVQAFSGFEGRVATSLREHIKLHNMEELFGEVMVPTEEVVEIRGGQRRKSERKFFPGYVLVQMVMNDASWHLVRSVPRVMGFIGGTSDRPAPISDKEVDAIMNRLQQVGDKPRPKTLFEPGEMVRVNDGPFADFNGVVEEVDYEKSRLKVSVSIFGRATPVELDFSQVEKSVRLRSKKQRSNRCIGREIDIQFRAFVFMGPYAHKAIFITGSFFEAILPNSRN